jgi:hypothetical protein
VPEGPLIIRSDGSQSPGTTVRASDWTLTFAPAALTFVRIDHQVRLQFEEAEVVIESASSVEIGDKRYDLDPGDRAGLGPLLSMYPATLESASLGDDGTLHLSFDNAGSISVPPDAVYEAWQISGPSTALVVCTPGDRGTLAVWG